MCGFKKYRPTNIKVFALSSLKIQQTLIKLMTLILSYDEGPDVYIEINQYLRHRSKEF